MKSKCELKNKLLKRVMRLGFAFLIIFLLGINTVHANFKYSDFDYDEFTEQTKNYWLKYCEEGDQACIDSIIKKQKKFYTKLYNLLAKYEARNYIIDDTIIIATAFFEFGPSDFRDGSGAYNMDNDDGKNYNIDADDDDVEFFKNETDTLKLLLKAMIGYERTCYGVTSAKEEVVTTTDEDGKEKTETRYVCNEGNLDGDNRCLIPLKSDSVSFWEKFADKIGSFFGIKNESELDCESLANDSGYSSYDLQTSKQKKVLESGYWDFLAKGRYFDNKPRLKHRYAGVLEKAGKTEIKDLYGNDEYEEDLVKVREDIIKDIKEIIDEYRKNRPETAYMDALSNKFWWPIGSAETEEKDGVLFASGDPISVAITSSFGTRIDPITHEAGASHHGIDIGSLGSNGSANVIAAKAGTVVTVNTNCTSGGDKSCGGNYGNYILIQHSGGLYTLYAHLHENTITVKKGDSVSQGEVIAKAGSSGKSTGTHLHFEVRVGPTSSNAVDPLEYVDPSDPRPKPLAIAFVDGGENMKSICLSLKSSGFSNNGVAAILTNINAESSFNPNAIGDSGTSYGLCQWHNERWDNLKAFTSAWQTVEGQLQFLSHELQTGYMGLYNSLFSGSSSANTLADNYCVQFERPADTEYTCQTRADTYSSTMLDYVNNGCN